jgi:hypothetical protein
MKMIFSRLFGFEPRKGKVDEDRERFGQCNLLCPFFRVQGQGHPTRLDDYDMLRGWSISQVGFAPRECNLTAKKGPNMDAMKLDVEAIRDRVLKQAVVVKDRGEIKVLIPLFNESIIESTTGVGIVYANHLSLTNGKLMDAENRGRTYDWSIRPGDEAEFTDDGTLWHRGTFTGLNSRIFYDRDLAFGKDNLSNWRYIRPVQTDPELEKARKEVAEARARLEQAEKHLEQAQR